MEFGVASELEASTPVRARALASGPHLLYACARIAAFHPPLLKQALLPRQLAHASFPALGRLASLLGCGVSVKRGGELNWTDAVVAP